MSEQAGPDEDARAKLIEAMAQSCHVRGYTDTTIEDLLADTGLRRAEFDRHFADTEECALAAVEAILAEGMTAVSDAYSPDTSEWESALGALRALLVLFAARPALARLAFIDSRQAMPPSALQRYESGFAILTAMLDRLRPAGVEGLQAPATAARAAIGGGEALVRRELTGGLTGDLPAVLPDVVYGATVAFMGQEQALRLSREAEKLIAERES